MEEEVASMSVGNFTQIIEAITSQVSIENILVVLTAVIGVAIGFVFFWWGGRKVASVVMSAFRKGRLSV